EDGDLVFPQMPCPYFGADGLCIVYDKRPRACREYPHLDQKRQKGLLGQHLSDLSICPAVALAAEYIEKLLKE
ncbi:MAG: YkgJ family cysteine cluster protein, partial [Spirochaetales bacterium]|nr:YkgJ family cysteine cluster protein [Spirochaetales bacterium]